MVAGNAKSQLSDLLVLGAELPSKILRRSFRKHLFFDADISSSEEMISAIHDIAIACFGLDAEAEIFTSWDQRFLGRLESHVNWAIETRRIHRAHREEGNAGGFTLVDTKQRWIAYQRIPVEIGLFATNSDLELSGLKAVQDGFFDSVEIANALLQRTPRDIGLVDSFGADFLAVLVKNYF